MTTIFKMLDVSTAHITQETADFITECIVPINMELSVSSWFDTGWIVGVPSNEEGAYGILALKGYRSLVAVFRRAVELKCDYIKLTADGEVIDGLETYNW